SVTAGIVTLPVLSFTIAPVFQHPHHDEIDLGPITNFKEGQFVLTTFLRDPGEGEISRRTAYIRNNGFIDAKPSFTVLSNRCAHLGCPVQPNGPMFDKQKIEETTKTGDVSLIPTLPAGGFGCPCHGGQYDQEGNRTAGPPVRALDRYEFYIRNGNLALGKTYSVSHVDGAAASARIHKYRETGPGQHVTNHVPLGWSVRGMHRWSASVFIILIFFHMARVFLFGAYKYPRELNWIVGALLVPLALLEGFSGYLLPYDQTAYWATVVGI